MVDTTRNPNVVDCCTAEGRLQALEGLADQLETCQKVSDPWGECVPAHLCGSRSWHDPTAYGPVTPLLESVTPF